MNLQRYADASRYTEVFGPRDGITRLSSQAASSEALNKDRVVRASG